MHKNLLKVVFIFKIQIVLIAHKSRSSIVFLIVCKPVSHKNAVLPH